MRDLPHPPADLPRVRLAGCGQPRRSVRVLHGRRGVRALLRDGRIVLGMVDRRARAPRGALGQAPQGRQASDRMRLSPRHAAAALLALAATGARADTAADVYAQLGIKTKDVMNSSVVTAKVLPGETKQVVSVLTYLTGKKGEDNALGVRLDVFRQEGPK